MKIWKKAAAFLAACTLCVPALTGCSESIDPSTIEYVQFEQPEEGQDIAIVDTSMGEITILLYTEEVPTLVNEFKSLAQDGFYDGQIIFHVEPAVGAVVTGSSTPDGNGGDSTTGKPIEATYSNNLWPFSGSVSMICYEAGMLWNKSNYFDSRFFFMGDVPVDEDTLAEMEQYNFPAMLKNGFEEFGGVPQFGRYHSVFGKVIDGMEVVNAILELPLTYESIDPTDAEASAADYPELDNTPTEDELAELKRRSAEEEAAKEAALNGESAPAQ